MNREKKDQLPTMQVAFIDSICHPVYEVSSAQLVSMTYARMDYHLTLYIFNLFKNQSFARLSPKLQPLLDGVKVNRNHWTKNTTPPGSENGD